MQTAPVLSTALLCPGIEKLLSLNSLARDGLALLGKSYGSALTDILHKFFAGEDPANKSPRMIRLKHSPHFDELLESNDNRTSYKQQ